MSTCPVCEASQSQEELVDEVFHLDGQYVLVGGIPAAVCVRCGEHSFSRETTEKVRALVYGEAPATKYVPMPVFDFGS